MARIGGRKFDKPAPKAPEPLIKCEHCGKYKESSKFYKSKLEEQEERGGTYPYCRDCLSLLCKYDMNNRDINFENFIDVLKAFNRPFIEEWYRKDVESVKDGNRFFGRYINRFNFPAYQNLRWEDGDLTTADIIINKRRNQREKTEKSREKAKLTEEVKKELGIENTKKENKIDDKELKREQKKEQIKQELLEKQEREELKEKVMEQLDDFVVTDEMVTLFGTGYTKEEYKAMWDKYEFLGANYSKQTNMHIEALVTYIRYKVKEEMAVSAGKAGEAKTWGELAMKQAERAKINPNQLTKADLQGGLSTIGEIAQAVEQNVDIIPILPKFKYRPNDAVDFCIWNYINYARALENKPMVEYSDVYGFYDKMKEEYIKSTGDPYHIFDNDPTTENRDKVKQFITLPDDYDEGGEE